MNMESFIKNFPQHITEALEIANQINLNIDTTKIQNILISGLGGSGIGGDYVRFIVKDDCRVPILVNRDYHIPAFVNGNTLAIFSSYSGNTEETLTAYQDTLNTGAQIVIITSGGKFEQLAKENNHAIIKITAGFPPRAALAYSIVQQLNVLKKLNLINENFNPILAKIASELSTNQEQIKVAAKDIVSKMGDSLPVIYAHQVYEPIAVRFRQQLNENSKILCWHHILPEMNHNEIVGWAESHPDKKVFFIQDAIIDPQMEKHTSFFKNLVEKLAEDTITIHPVGDMLIERYFYITHLVDWVSWYLAEERKQDAYQVNVINDLKKSLAE